MVRPLKPRKFTPPKKTTPTTKEIVGAMTWYGGKSRDAAAIASQFPPHDTYVEVFGGGGALLFFKDPSVVDVYNDLGNVSNFFYTLKYHGEEVYDLLYLTLCSRQEFFDARRRVLELLNKYGKDENGNIAYKNMPEHERIEWAVAWYIVVQQSFSHEEMASSWKVMKTGDPAATWNSHVEQLVRFIEKIRTVTIENLSFEKLLPLYDTPKTLFYLDPPYVSGTRAAGARSAYVHEMDISKHQVLLNYLKYNLKGQAVVSMYDYPLYNEMLSDWRRVEINHRSMIHNSSAKDTGTRTEVLWIKEHAYGLWSSPELFSAFSPDVSRVPGEKL